MITPSTIAVSDTGPLISAFQSDSLDLLKALFARMHVAETCMAELIRHGWQTALQQAQGFILAEALTDEERERAMHYAQQIAAHPRFGDALPANHLGEAEAMALAQRDSFAEAMFLVDEMAARTVAIDQDLNVIGFAGALVLAANEGLITPDDVRQRLQYCRQQGTHYSAALIERAFRLAGE